MNKKIERRLIPFSEFELRVAADGTPELVGYAAVFNQETVIAEWFSEWREEVAPGAYKKTIQEGDIRSLFNHDPNIVLGRNKAGTLILREDDHGLHTTIRPPDNEWGRPVLDAVRRGDVTGMSVVFRVVKESILWPEKGSGDLPKRTIKEAKLFDAGPVTFPAFTQTEIAARAIESMKRAGYGVPEPAPTDVDVLLMAGALARRAQWGMALSAEERKVIADAIDLLMNVSREPDGDGHSLAVPDDEPGANHSAEARARRLRLIHILQQGVIE